MPDKKLHFVIYQLYMGRNPEQVFVTTRKRERAFCKHLRALGISLDQYERYEIEDSYLSISASSLEIK